MPARTQKVGARHDASCFEALLEHNAARTRAFVQYPFFRIIDDGTLRDKRKRDTYLACIQRISSGFQTIMLTRQALCRDPAYYSVFLRHFEEEFGHDKLIAQRPDARMVNDTVVEAVLTWFAHQMIVLDNLEKTALMHLVLEIAGDQFHTRVAPILSRHVTTGYFETHAELDEHHAAMGVDLLAEQLTEASAARVRSLIDEAWDMLGTMIGRMAELVEEGP